MKTGKYLNYYGRRRGKKLSKVQNDYMTNYLPKVTPKNISWHENPDRKKLKIEEIFGETCAVWLEIGFGGGEHLLSIARKNRNIGIIGCEPYRNGVAMMLPRLAKENLSKVKVYMDDARILFEVLPNFSIAKIFLLFPDPWPKLRHKQRRFINKENLEAFKRILSVNALIHIATDVNEYARHVLETFNNDESFEWVAESANDWRNPWKDWEQTRYSNKASLYGRNTIFMIFKRL